MNKNMLADADILTICATPSATNNSVPFSDVIDIAEINRQFRDFCVPDRILYKDLLIVPLISSAKAEEEDFWGPDDDWDDLEDFALTSDEFKRISIYLEETGQSST